MTRLKTLAAALAATTLLAGVAEAADSAAHPAGTPPAISAQQKQVDAAVGKLSVDGIAAYRDVRLARLAIYEAKPDQARMFVSHAQSALDKAKTDDATFMKAEADLKSPAGMGTAANMAGNDGPKADAGKDAKADTKAASGKTASTQPTKWIPVDAQLVLADDFVVKNKDQAKAIDEANQHLKAGDRKGAIERLKLAGIEVDFTMAVVPLDKTVQGVNDAAKLIQDGKYYEANSALKGVEDGVRFDVIDATAVPQAAKTAKTGTTAASEASGTAAPAKAQ
ncbi:YfdX family protein [Methylobacterium sp. NEAU 140]|uniref:YfdX family protein n=1 Tax=Methylobacterium sp. NEAU 140 TaxID=3064945 RepID=UPI0027325470|nr:YfdX family protein [Methylobacterium sp. NEAU 140]MDP4024061.1 YfdX family protein [Methylobacterium sp. NEAU 140]